MGQMKRDLQFDPLLDDFRFRQHQQRGFDMEGSPFRAGFCAFFHRRFKRANEFRPAVRIAGIVEHVRAKIDERCSYDLRMRCRNREKDEIASRHIGDRNGLATLVTRSVLGHCRRAGERRPADARRSRFITR